MAAGDSLRFQGANWQRDAGVTVTRRIGAFVDFVIVGIVIGAVLVGAGALLRDLGPRLRPRISRPDSHQLEPEKLAHAWTRYCQSLGMAFTTLGFLIVVATVVGFFLNVSSGTGWTIVGVMTLLAIAGTAASIVKISGHYRSGGFDPRERTEQASPAFEWERYGAETVTRIVADETVLLGPDDPFTTPEPVTVAESPVDAMETGPEPSPDVEELVFAPMAADPTLAEDQPRPTFEEPESPEANGPAVDSLDLEEVDEIDEPPIEAEPEPVTGEPGLPNLPKPEVAEVLEPESAYIPKVSTAVRVESWQQPEHDLRPPKLLPPTQVPVLSGFEPPLIDPDDDLPAWGAPPVVERITPVAFQHTPQPGGPRVFESSLLADLQPDSALAEDLAGPFQSRLLNELTADRDKAEQDGDDVLIAETPVVDPDRGARSE